MGRGPHAVAELVLHRQREEALGSSVALLNMLIRNAVPDDVGKSPSAKGLSPLTADIESLLCQRRTAGP